jgi:hypothetical protein
VRALNAQSNEGSFHSRHSNDDPQHLPTEDWTTLCHRWWRNPFMQELMSEALRIIDCPN